MPELHAGRAALLGWVNDCLLTNYQSVEGCADGVVYCQLLDAVHPNIVPLHKLNFNARFDTEYEKNLQVLKDGFTKARVEFDVPVGRLMKGRFQDNSEFLWRMHDWVERRKVDLTHFGHDAYQRRMLACRKQARQQASRQAGKHNYSPRDSSSMKGELHPAEPLQSDVDTVRSGSSQGGYIDPAPFPSHYNGMESASATIGFAVPPAVLQPEERTSIEGLIGNFGSMLERERDRIEKRSQRAMRLRDEVEWYHSKLTAVLQLCTDVASSEGGEEEEEAREHAVALMEMIVRSDPFY